MYLTDNSISKAKPKEKLYKLRDGEGLFVHVQPNGTKRFVLAYRFEGKQKSLSFGVYPETSLKQARKKKEEARALIAQGVDPQQAKKSVKREKATQGLTFKDASEAWFLFWEHGKSERTKSKTSGILNNYLLPSLGNIAMTDITRIQLVEPINQIVNAGFFDTATSACSIIERIFDHSINLGHLEYSVAHKLAAIVPAYKHTHHPAIIDKRELGILLKALYSEQAFTYSVKYALRLLPYVFVRNSELRCARWEEFDLAKGEWHIPGERMKMKTPHLVPLARQVVDILYNLKELAIDENLLFPSTGNRRKPISDNAMRLALLRLGYEKEEISVHGFRTTASTLLHEMGFNTQIIEKQLAHKDTNAVRDAYNRAEFIEERRNMMQQWADYLDSLRES